MAYPHHFDFQHFTDIISLIMIRQSCHLHVLILRLVYIIVVRFLYLWVGPRFFRLPILIAPDRCRCCCRRRILVLFLSRHLSADSMR